MSYNYKNFLQLKNRKIYILGGLGLIGKEISKGLSQNGAKIIILDLIKRQSKNKRNNIVHCNFDCSDTLNIEDNLKDIYNLYGCPDVFINCSYPKTDNWNTQNSKNLYFKFIEDNIKIHLNTSILISNFFANKMKKGKIRGSIINFSSIYGVLVQDENLYQNTNVNLNMIYGVIKSGISHFTKQLASVYGKYNIRANSIAPGGLYGHIAGSKFKQDKIFINRYSIGTPLKRLGYPYEVANLTLFLASDASSYITGQTILIDGGRSII